MIETYRNLQERRSAGAEEAGFTLIELLIVIVVLGILAAIVVFALGGVTGQSQVAACNSDSKTVDISIAALQAENPTWSTMLTTSQGAANGWKPALLGTSTSTTPIAGAPFLQTWPAPSNSAYSISIAGSSAVADTGTGDVTVPNNGDVIVTVPGVVGTVPHAGTYDATQNPAGACTYA